MKKINVLNILKKQRAKFIYSAIRFEQSNRFLYIKKVLYNNRNK